MSKTKTPFHSFKAHGTIAGSVTYQDRNRATMVRRKPTPTDRKSLPQIYHRWLYQDGAALWHTLSVAQKEQWESDARPFRITGFNYFMRTYLTTLPDLAAGYHLDALSPTTAIDFSKNTNDGLIYGASPAKGLIQNALLFDGVDDYINAGNDPSLNTQETTIMFFIKPLSFPGGYGHGIIDHSDISNGLIIGFYFHLLIFATITAGVPEEGPTSPLTLNTWYHIAIVLRLNHRQIFRDGLLYVEQTDTYPLPGATSDNFEIGKMQNVYWGENYFHGLLDELRVYNRPLDPIQIKRHSERRYPL